MQTDLYYWMESTVESMPNSIRQIQSSKWHPQPRLSCWSRRENPLARPPAMASAAMAVLLVEKGKSSSSRREHPLMSMQHNVDEAWRLRSTLETIPTSIAYMIETKIWDLDRFVCCDFAGGGFSVRSADWSWFQYRPAWEPDWYGFVRLMNRSTLLST